MRRASQGFAHRLRRSRARLESMAVRPHQAEHAAGQRQQGPWVVVAAAWDKSLLQECAALQGCAVAGAVGTGAVLCFWTCARGTCTFGAAVINARQTADPARLNQPTLSQLCSHTQPTTPAPPIEVQLRCLLCGPHTFKGSDACPGCCCVDCKPPHVASNIKHEGPAGLCARKQLPAAAPMAALLGVLLLLQRQQWLLLLVPQPAAGACACICCCCGFGCCDCWLLRWWSAAEVPHDFVLPPVLPYRPQHLLHLIVLPAVPLAAQFI